MGPLIGGEEVKEVDEEDDYNEDWGLQIGDNYRPGTPPPLPAGFIGMDASGYYYMPGFVTT